MSYNYIYQSKVYDTENVINYIEYKNVNEIFIIYTSRVYISYMNYISVITWNRIDEYMWFQVNV